MVLQTYEQKPLTTVYRKPPIKADDVGSRSVLFFIPGNPGLVEFYITYLNLIQEQYPHLEVFGVGHAGYQTTGGIMDYNTGNHQFYDLNYQIDHKYEIIKKYILDNYDENEDNKVQIYFLAHSVGSYVLQRVTKRLLDCQILHNKFQIKFTGLICPTIMDIGKSDNGIKFKKLFAYLPFVTILLWLAKFLNLFLTNNSIKRIIKNKYIKKEYAPIKGRDSKQDEHIQDSIDNSVNGIYNIVKSDRIIKQTLNLAQQELQSINQEQDMNDWYFSNMTNVWSFFAVYDYWISDQTRDHLIKKYHNLDKNIRFELGNEKDAITHSFCVHQSVEFAEITVARLQDFFPSGLGQ